MHEAIQPTIIAIREAGKPFTGILYAGLILTEKGPRVLEFNARFGDPETQAILPLLKSSLLDACLAVAERRLHTIKLEWENAFTCCVVKTSQGYPEQYEKGFEIQGLNNAETTQNSMVFHAGTTFKDGKTVTNGGRVLNCVGKAPSLAQAVEKAYELSHKISFQGAFQRKDIGKRALTQGQRLV